MSWRSELIAILQGDGVGTLNVDLFFSSKARIPVLPSGAATLTITTTGGSGSEGTHNSTIKPAYVRPGAHLLARADTFAKAEAMAQAAYDSLVKIRNQFVGSGWYRSIKALTEPGEEGGPDDRAQARCSFNVLADKRPS